MAEGPFEEPVRIPIGPEIDLHTFSPRDVGAVLPAYFEACVDRGIESVRVIHGKGTGTLRASVLSILARSPLVISYRQAEPTAGSWGATVVRLAAKKAPPNDAANAK